MTLTITSDQMTLIVRSLLNRRDMLGDMAKIYTREENFDQASRCIEERKQIINLLNNLNELNC